ncbi:UDP-3-O-(3-hydroxymyristoyl)glucosamine N-acyltransferase [candidate division KSB1 bacterium]|nr:UDP-3-O-(3-hydroxymyristoyl)glucosamine N-acyltransferase [candidate division KSB1 bacterium]
MSNKQKAYHIEVQDNSVAIIGWEEGHAGRIETWLEKVHNYHIACFINPSDTPLDIDPNKIKRDVSQFSYPTENEFKNKPLLNTSQWADSLKKIGINKALVTTDNPKKRYEEICYAKENNLELINAIHPTAYLMEDVLIKENVILHEHSYIGYRTELYDGVIIDGAYLAHHNVIKDCSEIVCGAVLGGNVTIGRFTRVYLGAIIKNRTRVGENSIVGAGSVVLSDVNDNTIVAQKPGKMILGRN